MKIKEVTWQIDNDFYAKYECEGCGHITDEISGYNDYFFHNNIIPSMTCEKCGKSRNQLEDK